MTHSLFTHRRCRRTVARWLAAYPNELLRALGGAVRTFRLGQGLTQERLAEAAGLHTTYLSDIERGLRNVGIINLDRLASALSIDLPTLTREVEARRRGGPIVRS